MGSQYIVVNPGETLSDGDVVPVHKASAINGGFTVVAAHVTTDAVGTFNIVLQNYGAGGTVAGGTVGNMSGGTATVWAADTPQSLTLSTTLADRYIDSGEWLFAKLVAGDGVLTIHSGIYVEIVEGVVDAG